MTTDEFIDRKTIMHNKILIKVFEHKTVVARGPANVVISRDVKIMILKYYVSWYSNFCGSETRNGEQVFCYIFRK